MSASQRLQVLQTALVDRGLEDVKFFVTTGEVPHSHIESDVVEALSMYHDGKVRPITDLKDTVR